VQPKAIGRRRRLDPAARSTTCARRGSRDAGGNAATLTGLRKPFGIEQHAGAKKVKVTAKLP
jgi:hypothetical protein